MSDSESRIARLEQWIARLEQWKQDHNNMADRRFDDNDRAHARLTTGIEDIKTRVISIEGKLMYAAGMVTLVGLFLGAVVGFVVANGHHLWQLIRGQS